MDVVARARFRGVSGRGWRRGGRAARRTRARARAANDADVGANAGVYACEILREGDGDTFRRACARACAALRARCFYEYDEYEASAVFAFDELDFGRDGGRMRRSHARALVGGTRRE